MKRLIGRRYSSTHFGFKTVNVQDKEKLGILRVTLVKNVFSNVASNYDVMNDVMSGGIHRLWKDQFVSSIAPGPFTKVLDVAGGTGDIALRMLDYVKSNHGSTADFKVTVLDINENMLKFGREKAQENGYLNPLELEFVCGNAENLDIPSESVDVYSIAFGIRNCTDILKVLKEANRVLKKGGRFACLEFSHVENPLLKAAYDTYSFNLIPLFGQLVANDRESYEYLVESIRKFPKQQEFAEMIKSAGFTTVGSGYQQLTFGVVAIHSGWKL